MNELQSKIECDIQESLIHQLQLLYNANQDRHLSTPIEFRHAWILQCLVSASALSLVSAGVYRCDLSRELGQELVDLINEFVRVNLEGGG